MIDKIYAKHNYWIGLAIGYGITDYPEDAVQDAYIKIYDKKDINLSYFGLVLRSVCFDVKRKRKLDTIPFYNNLDTVDTVSEMPVDITERLFSLDNWAWDDKLFYLKYIEEELSMRKFANKYNYNCTFVFRKLKELKLKLNSL